MQSIEDFRNKALICARLAEAVYESPDVFSDAVHGIVDADNVDWIDVRDTQVAVVNVPKRVGPSYVVFRGTQISNGWSWGDIAANLALRPTVLPGHGSVHRGYWQAYLSSIHGISEALVPGRQYIATGHSLGGVLATLHAAASPATVAELITFGAPRPGDSEFSSRAVPMPWQRIVHGDDIAPRHPAWWLGYRHGGQRWALSRSGRVSRETWQFWHDLTLPYVIMPPALAQGVLDHRIDRYVSALRGADL